MSCEYVYTYMQIHNTSCVYVYIHANTQYALRIYIRANMLTLLCSYVLVPYLSWTQHSGAPVWISDNLKGFNVEPQDYVLKAQLQEEMRQSDINVRLVTESWGHEAIEFDKNESCHFSVLMTFRPVNDTECEGFCQVPQPCDLMGTWQNFHTFRCICGSQACSELLLWVRAESVTGRFTAEAVVFTD